MQTMQQAVRLPLSGAPVKFNNAVAGVTSLTIQYKVNGSPASLVIYLLGHNSGEPDAILDTYSGTSSTTRTVSLSASFASFIVVALWTGGASAVYVHATMTVSGPGPSFIQLTDQGVSSLDISASETIPSGTELVFATGGASGISLAMPAIYNGMPPITFVKVDSGAGAVTITGAGGFSYELVNQNQSVTVGTNGTKTYVIGNN
jgi:hypothetical protein